MVYGFSEVLLKPNYDEPVDTPELHLELWEYYCSPEQRVAIAAPRGHAKSTAGTHAFGLAAILFRFKSYILIVSDTLPQAKEFLADIKRELMENDQLREVFGVGRVIKDNEETIIMELNNDDGTKQEFRITAKGSGQSMRGAKWRNKRPDLILGDDLENDDIVENEDRREKFRKWFYKALLPSGSKSCLVRIAGTILHFDSLLERVMPQIGDEGVIDTPLKLYSEAKVDDWLAVKYRAHDGNDPDDAEFLLWEEQWPKERLAKEKAGYVKQGMPEGYAQEYLNYPLDDATSYFRKTDILEVPPEKTEPYMEYYCGIDMAISEKDRRAFTVIATVGVTASNQYRVVDVQRFRGDAYDIIEEMFSLHKIYKYQLMFVEEENIARALGPVINREMAVRGSFLPLRKMVATQDKPKRARAMQSAMRANIVYFYKLKEWYGKLEMELLQFPKSVYLDQVDALAWIFLGLDAITEVPDDEELIEEQYQDELDDFDELSGICEITGY